MSYLLFLTLFSYTLLVEFRAREIEWCEIALTLWVEGHLLEQVREMFFHRGDLLNRLHRHLFHSFRNASTMLAIILFAPGIVLGNLGVDTRGTFRSRSVHLNDTCCC